MNTIDYYNENAKKYFETTYKANMSKQYEMFLKYIKERGSILDFGCGSGRDSLYFKDLGYKVTAIDGSEEMCKLARQYTGLAVKHMQFLDLCDIEAYDGIWACASILHAPRKQMIDILKKMRNALQHDGSMYVTLKNGTTDEITPECRSYSYYSKDEFEEKADSANLKVVEYTSSLSVTNSKEERYWHNFILQKKK